MNRRSFLSFLSVAPVAVPMAAQASASKYREWTTNFEWAEGISGEHILSVDAVSVGYAPGFHSTVEAIEESTRLQTLFRAHTWRHDVEAQMREHDVFDFEPHLRDTPEQHALVSPDDQEKRKPESRPA